MTDRAGNEIVVSFDYSTRQHSKALERTRELKLVQNGFLILVALYLGTEIYEWFQGETSISTGWPWSLLKGLIILGGLTMPSWIIRIMRSQNDSDFDGAPQYFRFSRSGFALVEGAPLTPWGLMDRVTEVKGAILLKDSLSKWPVYMPTSALSTKDLERLRSIIRDEFASRPEKLRLLQGGS